MSTRPSSEALLSTAKPRRWAILLRGRWGKAVDRLVTRATAFSPIAAQYAFADRRPITPALVLTTIGNRSGDLRTVVLPFYRVDGELVIAAVNRAGPRHPHWLMNLRHEPRCRVTIARKTTEAHAAISSGHTRESLRAAMLREKPQFPQLEERAAKHGRRIELVALRTVEPIDQPLIERWLRRRV